MPLLVVSSLAELEAYAGMITNSAREDWAREQVALEPILEPLSPTATILDELLRASRPVLSRAVQMVLRNLVERLDNEPLPKLYFREFSRRKLNPKPVFCGIAKILRSRDSDIPTGECVLLTRRIRSSNWQLLKPDGDIVWTDHKNLTWTWASQEELSIFFRALRRCSVDFENILDNIS